MVAKLELKRAVEFVKNSPISPVPDDTASFDEEVQKLRWFLLPCEAAAQMRGEVSKAMSMSNFGFQYSLIGGQSNLPP